MRRGLTLVELLASLLILSAVMLGAAAWTRAAATMAAHAGPAARERAAIEAALRLVTEDIATGNLDDPRAREALHASVDDGVLVVRTRETEAALGPGPVTHRYVYAPAQGTLELHASRARSPTSVRPLAIGITAWNCSIDEEAWTLTIRVEGVKGTIVERRCALP